MVKNYPQMARLLLESGANPNLPDVKNYTPLYRAVRDGQDQVAMLLIANPKTDVDLANDNNWSPLMAATAANNLKILHAMQKQVHPGNCFGR